MPRLRMSTALIAFAVLAVALGGHPVAADWPGLRGPGHDGAVRDARLFDGEPGFSVAWKRELGSGYSVVAVDGKRLVAAFQSGAHDIVAGFDLATGDELWRHEIGRAYAGHTGSHDGPIATPALVEGRVFGVGPHGQLFALDAANGQLLWTKNLADDLGAEAPYYGFGASPIVAGNVVIVQIGAPEGKSIGGFDVASGELLWSTGDAPVEYNTPIAANLGGQDQVVAASTKVLRGIDPSSGTVLWSHEHGGDERAMGGATVIPVPAGENRLLLLNQQDESVMFEITLDGDAWQVAEVWKTSAMKGTYVQPVYHQGYIYGMNGKIFTCIDAATGELQWRSREPGDGFPTLVGDHLVIMSKPGVLRVAEASPDGYKELASVSLFDQVSWSAPAYSGGHLYLRSLSSLARVDPVAALSKVAEVAEAAEVEEGASDAEVAEDAHADSDGDGDGDAVGEATAEAAPVGAMAMTVAKRPTGFAGFLSELAESECADEKNACIDAYLDANSVPVIENSGAVHFLYRGEAEDVGIVGDMIGFRREDPMTRVEGTDLFYYTTRLEPDAAVHYGFLVDYDEPSADPLNLQGGDGLFGEVSFLAMPGRDVADFSAQASADRQGRLEEVSWESTAMEGETRQAQVYLPVGYEAEGEARYPTLYFHEGDEALEKGHFKNALDHLIGDSVAPLIAVFITPADPENSGRELRSPKYSAMFLDELVPLIDERYATLDDPMARASAGSGSGGDFSFRLAFASPDRVARVGSLWAGLFAFGAEIPASTDSPLVIYQRWGAYHLRSPHENFDSAVSNRDLRQKLRDKGHRPAGGEVNEGLGWNNAKGYVGEMLRALFPAS